MTPAMQKIGVQLFEKEAQAILPLITKNRPVPENVQINVKIDPNYIKALATQTLFRSAWQLYNQSWSVLIDETGHSFLTSDNPSAILPPEFIGGPSARILPLSPRLCVATLMDQGIKYPRELSLADLQRPSQGSISYIKANAERTEFVNSLTVQNAENLVFACTADANVAACVERYRDHQVQLVHLKKSTPADGGFWTQTGIYVGLEK